MPFEEDLEDISNQEKSKNLKQVSSKKSIFADVPKKPSHTDFTKRVEQTEKKIDDYKLQGVELSSRFINLINDKTLHQNKSTFAKQIEKEVLSDLVKFAVEVNNDPVEQEGMGSVAVITLLSKVCLMQRNKINELDFRLTELIKKNERT